MSLLVTALFKSLHGIATRKTVLRVTKSGKEIAENFIAVTSAKGIVRIINCSNATIRFVRQDDQERLDWEPFQPMPDAHVRVNKNQPGEMTIETNPKKLTIKGPLGRPKKSPPVKIEGDDSKIKDFCARCTKHKSEALHRTTISMKGKWMCEECLPPR